MKSNDFAPDYTNLLDVLSNRRPGRLPVYEHHIDAPFISKVLGEELSPEYLNSNELTEYYRKIIGFWKDMTYDGFDFEAAICDIFRSWSYYGRYAGSDTNQG